MDAFLALLSQSLTSPVLLAGHFTYVLMLLSLLMRRIAWLRALAIIAGLAKIIYRLFFVYDPVSVMWETIFVFVNLGQLLLIWWENRRPKLSAEAQQFIDTVAPELPNSAIRALLKRGEWAHVASGTRLIEEGQSVSGLTYIAKGRVAIQRGSRSVASCTTGDFLGEMTYHNRKAATATAVALEPLRVLRFARDPLERLIKRKPVIRYALQASFNRNLIDKLARSNDAGDAQPA
jgi:hypothetical protein